jgi:hypothetical protein
MTTDERFAHAADLLVKIAAFAASPTLVTFGAASVGGYLNLKALVGRVKSTDLASLVEEDLRRGLNVRGTELPDDADVLFFQMLEFGAPNLRDLVELDLSPERIATLISHRADGPDYSVPGLRSSFESWIIPPLTTLLNDSEFITSLAPDITRRTLESLTAIGLGIETLQLNGDELRVALAETTALVKSIDQSVTAIRSGKRDEEGVEPDSETSVTHILAARIALGTYSDDEVREIRRRLEDCKKQFMMTFQGKNRAVCLCFVLEQVKDGNGGTLPDPDWQRDYSQLGCDNNLAR